MSATVNNKVEQYSTDNDDANSIILGENMDALAAYTKIAQQPQEALVQDHAVLVKRIACHMISRLPPSVMLDDLIQAGMIGLLEAAKHYDDQKGASFETYAGIRIRGHILDEMRANDWLPRSMHKNARRIAEAIHRVENRLGRSATDAEVAQEMGMKLEDYFQLLQESSHGPLLSLEDLGFSEEGIVLEEDAENSPLQQLMQAKNMQYLVEQIEALPEREKLVLSLYYEQELNLKEIGEVIGVGESRVSQIMSQALMRIRAHLGSQ